MKTILYVCGHNAGRSQMAEAITNYLAQARGMNVRAESAGTDPGNRINPLAEAVMQEIGISMAAQYPKTITPGMVDRAETVITMGCGVDVDHCPATTFVADDWGLDDPAGQPLEVVRCIRDQIKARVEALMEELAGQ